MLILWLKIKHKTNFILEVCRRLTGRVVRSLALRIVRELHPPCFPHGGNVGLTSVTAGDCVCVCV